MTLSFPIMFVLANVKIITIRGCQKMTGFAVVEKGKNHDMPCKGVFLRVMGWQEEP